MYPAHTHTHSWRPSDARLMRDCWLPCAKILRKNAAASGGSTMRKCHRTFGSARSGVWACVCVCAWPIAGVREKDRAVRGGIDACRRGGRRVGIAVCELIYAALIGFEGGTANEHATTYYVSHFIWRIRMISLIILDSSCLSYMSRVGF